jgi:hypothetical protein
MIQSANTSIEFCQEFRAFFASVGQLLVEYIQRLPLFIFGKLGQLFEDSLKLIANLNFIPYRNFFESSSCDAWQ